METTFDHNRLLKKIAKERLLPYGIVQEGKSRTFLYDNGWWTIIIEFQPSSFSKGTYLNIGVDFNFYPRDHFAFTYGHREKGYKDAKDEKLFEQIVSEYCNYTIAKVEELKVKFQDVYFAIATFKKVTVTSDWNNFDLGILYGIAGELSEAKKYLKKVVEQKCKHPYEFERQKLTTEILPWLSHHSVFLENIKLLINKTRQMKKLPPVDLGEFQKRKIASNWFFALWQRLMGK